MTRKSAGRRLFDDLARPSDPEHMIALATEAMRARDRFDKLDKLVTGQQSLWMRLRGGRDGDLYVSIDAALAESRQTAGLLRQLIATITRLRAGVVPITQDDLDGLT